MMLKKKDVAPGKRIHVVGRPIDSNDYFRFSMIYQTHLRVIGQAQYEVPGAVHSPFG